MLTSDAPGRSAPAVGQGAATDGTSNVRNDSRLPDTGHVKTTMTRLGRDGKSYPASPLTRQDRNRARWMAHHLVHRDGLSIRAAQARMAEAGLRRSVGIIMQDLEGFECPHCPGLDT